MIHSSGEMHWPYIFEYILSVNLLLMSVEFLKINFHLIVRDFRLNQFYFYIHFRILVILYYYNIIIQ